MTNCVLCIAQNSAIRYHEDIFYVLRRRVCICYFSVIIYINISYDISRSGFTDTSMLRKIADFEVATVATFSNCSRSILSVGPC